MKIFKNHNCLFVLSIVLFVFIRIIFLFRNGFILNGDEAVFGLMAKNIMECKEFPLFVLLAHYGGTSSCYILALLYKFFGVNHYLIKFLMVFYETLAVFLFSLVFGKNKRFFVFLFFSFIPGYFVDISLSFIGYVETIIFGFCVLFVHKNIISSKKWLIIGFLNGLGIYLQPIFLPFFILTIIILILDKTYEDFKRRIFLEIGFLLGLFPLIYYNILNPFATFLRLGSRFISHSLFDFKSYFYSLFHCLLSNLNWFLLPLFLTLAFSFFYHKKLKDDGNYKVLLIMSLISLVLFFPVFKGWGANFRYLYPFIYSLVAFECFLFIKMLEFDRKIAFLYFFISIFSGFISFVKYKKVIFDYPALTRFLIEKNIEYCYSNYWTSYPLMFYSNNKIISSPRLGDPSGFYDRTPLYFNIVSSVDDKCIIIPQDLKDKYGKRVIEKISRLNLKVKFYKIKEFEIIKFNYNGSDYNFL